MRTQPTPLWRTLNTAISAATLAVLLAGCQPQTDTSQSRLPDFNGWPRIHSPYPADPAMEARITELLDTLTVEEKVGQMVQADIRQITPEEVRRHHIGSVLNGGLSAPGGREPGGNKLAPVSEWLTHAQAYWEASMDTSGGRTAIPVMWGTDAVHGHNNVVGATVFPHNIGLGAANDRELMRRIGEITAREVAVTGLDWTFAPTLAVVRDDRWGRSYEGYAEIPRIVQNLAAPYILGLQDNFGPGNILATAKHFLGDGGTQYGADRGDTTASPGELLSIHAPGYFSALSAGAQTVMVSYSSWNGVKMHAHRQLITDLLKNHLGFDGLVLSDWEAIDAVPGCNAGNCPGAVNAGLDMIMLGHRYHWLPFIRNTVAQVQSGAIPMERVDDAVRRILRVKMRAGLFDKPGPAARPLAGNTALFGSDTHRAVAREAVRKSLVLLKNRDALLPLPRQARLLVAGKSAHSYANQTGGWTITWQNSENTNSDFQGATSVWEGIRAIAPDAEFSADGTTAAAGDYDAAIVVIGERPYAEFEGDLEEKTLEHARLYPEDLALLKRLDEAGLPVVTVFISGRPLYVNAELNRSDAFVAAWLPGSEGAGIADVLFRDEAGDIGHDFSGKLSFSWPAGPCQTPVNAGDPDYSPLFPLGYGLSYAEGQEGPDSRLPEETIKTSCKTRDKEKGER